ncbi:MAG: DUF4411 family protein [bacterium]|nr:DUF4411 family protein [bacterium]
MKSLFSVTPKFTIDTCSFNEMFDDERASNRKNFPGIWEGVEELISSGEIISHEEVYEEIMDGPYEDLKTWARNNKHVFEAYDYVGEGKIIADMGKKGFAEFVHQRKKKHNADPWLVAQAKKQGLRIITQERKKGIRDIPRVAEVFKIDHLDIFALVKEKGWVLRRGR